MSRMYTLYEFVPAQHDFIAVSVHHTQAEARGALAALAETHARCVTDTAGHVIMSCDAGSRVMRENH